MNSAPGTTLIAAQSRQDWDQLVHPYVLAAVILILRAPPLILYALRKPSWITHEAGDDMHAGSSAVKPDANGGPPRHPRLR